MPGAVGDVTATDLAPIPRSQVMTYWRAKLYGLLRQTKLITSLVVDGQSLTHGTVSWREYWGEVPLSCFAPLADLKRAWEDQIASGFSNARAQRYGAMMLGLLKAAWRAADSDGSALEFLGRVLGFENFGLRREGVMAPFAAMTTTFRNPFLASLRTVGVRVGSRDMPRMLPLVMVHAQDRPRLFYHYRKQRILRNDDKGLLFFPAVEPEDRGDSFRGLDLLTNVLVPQWDSRVEERARLIAEKTLVPVASSSERTRRSLRVLDIGSGDGLFTDKVISKLLDSGAAHNRKIELSLLDVVKGIQRSHSGAGRMLRGLSKVERIVADYREWLGSSVPRYDVAFLFRILHNFSRFEVRSVCANAGRTVPENRYPVLPHMSGYYEALSLSSLNCCRVLIRMGPGRSIIRAECSKRIAWRCPTARACCVACAPLPTMS